MRLHSTAVMALGLGCLLVRSAYAQDQHIEVSDDGHQVVVIKPSDTDGDYDVDLSDLAALLAVYGTSC